MDSKARELQDGNFILKIKKELSARVDFTIGDLRPPVQY